MFRNATEDRRIQPKTLVQLTNHLPELLFLWCYVFRSCQPCSGILEILNMTAKASSLREPRFYLSTSGPGWLASLACQKGQKSKFYSLQSTGGIKNQSLWDSHWFQLISYRTWGQSIKCSLVLLTQGYQLEATPHVVHLQIINEYLELKLSLEKFISALGLKTLKKKTTQNQNKNLQNKQTKTKPNSHTTPAKTPKKIPKHRKENNSPFPCVLTEPRNTCRHHREVIAVVAVIAP